MSSPTVRIDVSGARGESFADVARRTGLIGDTAVPPGATDAEVLALLTSEFAAIVAAAPYTVLAEVKAAATGNVTVSNPGTAVFDGVALTNGQRLLLPAQSSGAQNGIYQFNGSGSALTRVTDFDQTAEVVQGSYVRVTGGSTMAGAWVMVTADPITVGTTAQVWNRFDVDALAILARSTGADAVGTPDGPLQDMLNARPIRVTSKATMKGLNTSRFSAVLLDLSASDCSIWVQKTGTPPTDPQEGLYAVSTATSGRYWARIWDGIFGFAEWCGAVADSASGGIPAANVVAIHAALALFPKVQLRATDYYVNATVKLTEAWMDLRGAGDKYNAVTGKMTRLVTSSGSTSVLQCGPDSDPGGGINSYPQGIHVSDIYLTRSVAPVIASNCVGVRTQFALYARLENLKSNGSMIGFQEGRTVHTHKINCEAVRDNGGSGAGTDYFVGHEAEGSNPFGAGLGANASLYQHDCVANCNYGPLQSAVGTVGFKADHFQDVWYFNAETTNCYIGQAFYGNDVATLEYSNADCKVFHSIHDQFKYAGTYCKDVNAAGAISFVEPYYGPSAGARSGHFVDSCEGNVSLRGGQFLMGVAPGCQPITLVSSRGANILGYPVILDAGNTYPVVGAADCADTIIEVTGRNPTVSAGALVQLSGASENIYVAPQASGKAAAFQYGIQVTGTPVRCTFDVSRLNSAAMQAVDRQLNVLTAAITSAGAVSGATSCIAQGNFN